MARVNYPVLVALLSAVITLLVTADRCVKNSLCEELTGWQVHDLSWHKRKWPARIQYTMGYCHQQQ